MVQKDKPLDDRSAAADRGKSVGSGPDVAVHRAIGNRLRALYDEVAQEPVPDRFHALLARLDQESSETDQESK